MKARNRTTPFRDRLIRRLWKTRGAMLGAFALAAAAAAQQVLVPLPAIPVEQPQAAPENGETNQLESTTAAAAATLAPHKNEPFQYGPVTLHPHLLYGFTHGNGIQSAAGVPQTTAINQIAPGVGFDLGTRWKLDYTPTVLLYSNPNFKNTVNQFITLSGNTAYEDWTFGLAQNCALTSDPLVQTAQQTDQQDYLTLLKATCRLNTSTSLELNAAQDLRYAQAFADTANWSTTDWLNYQFGPGFGTAGGASFGYVHVSAGTDMTFQQIQARITWRVAQKVNLSMEGGGEVTEFIDSTQPNLVTPIVDVSLDYRPFDVTAFTLSAGRTVSASYFDNQVAENAGVNASISQRFLKRLYFGLFGSYANTLYHATIPGVASGRKDNYASFGVSLRTTFLKRGNASVFYVASRNTSNQAGYGYNSDQVGFQLSFGY